MANATPPTPPTPKTIQIFLPGGDPRGIRVAEITTRIVQVIEVPRSLLGAFLSMPEARQVAVYFLFGGDESGEGERVYVGQTGDLRGRLKSHHANKDFWERALVLISRTNNLTQTHALYLEWLCIQQARAAGRYPDENGNAGSQPFTPAPMEADCQEIFETGKTLLSTLGWPVFTGVAESASAPGERLYFCRRAGCDARGRYTPEGFVVLAGSRGKRESAASIRDVSGGRLREKLIGQGVMDVEGDRVVFPKDHVFSSPSTAAMVVTGRSANGWTEWKTEDGRTLDEVERSSGETGEES